MFRGSVETVLNEHYRDQIAIDEDNLKFYISEKMLSGIALVLYKEIVKKHRDDKLVKLDDTDWNIIMDELAKNYLATDCVTSIRHDSIHYHNPQLSKDPLKTYGLLEKMFKMFYMHSSRNYKENVTVTGKEIVAILILRMEKEVIHEYVSKYVTDGNCNTIFFEPASVYEALELITNSEC